VCAPATATVEVCAVWQQYVLCCSCVCCVAVICGCGCVAASSFFFVYVFLSAWFACLFLCVRVCLCFVFACACARACARACVRGCDNGGGGWQESACAGSVCAHTASMALIAPSSLTPNLLLLILPPLLLEVMVVAEGQSPYGRTSC
jgi:hypothetical protein